MPPRRKAAAPPAPPPPLLDGLKIALCGTFPGFSHVQLKKQLEDHGAEPLNSVTPEATHLIATLESFQKPSVKVKAATKLDIPVLQLDWLLDCGSDKARKPEAPYRHGFTSSQTLAPTANPTINTKKRPTPAPDTDDEAGAAEEEEEEAKPARKTRAKAAPKAATKADAKTGPKAGAKAGAKADTKSKSKAAAAAAAASPVSDSEPPPKKVKKVSAQADIPVDKECHIPTARVHVDSDGCIWDASLNQTNSGANNNKFYIIQLLFDGKRYLTWTRWGRVGDAGQKASLGDGTLDSCVKLFQKKFKDKSGLSWEDRMDNPRPGKYVYIEKSYEPDSEKEEDDDDGDGDDVVKEEEEEAKPPECTLHPSVQGLMEMIFNSSYFQASMAALKYDAQKLPLGKLSGATIRRGFQALKDLSALMDDHSLAASEYHTDYDGAVQQLSNMYYSLIPHAFGRSRPPVICNVALIKQEVDLLSSLSDMKDADLLMKVQQAADKNKQLQSRMHAADQHYQSLNMKEMTPLDAGSREYQELYEYLLKTRGATHTGVRYQGLEIFRIERSGEQDRFDKSVVTDLTKDKRLLWHGSRATNFAGILSQGLRIAPPEAPVTGYMFGKGIYLADMSSKSAGYCYPYLSGGTALLLLCEADLGTPMLDLTNACPTAGEDARKTGLYTTLGHGHVGPLAWKDAGCVHADLAGVQMPDVEAATPGPTNYPNACLQYNEYIVYDISQIRLRYLFKVKMV